MSWQPTDTMSLKKEFIHFAQQSGANVSALCAGFGISRKTGYKWLRRFREGGAAGLEERPRRPLRSPSLTGAGTAARITELRREHPAWGARKLRAVLAREGVPMPSGQHRARRAAARRAHHRGGQRQSTRVAAL
jgi:transposase-like protein